MDLTTLNIKIPPNWGLVDSNPDHLIYKSPFNLDPNASIDLINDDGKIYGLIKSSENINGTQVLLGRGLPAEIWLMLMVDILANNIFDFEEFEN